MFQDSLFLLIITQMNKPPPQIFCIHLKKDFTCMRGIPINKWFTLSQSGEEKLPLFLNLQRYE